MRSAPVMICAPAVERPAVRMGGWGRNSRKHREDGADDHPPEGQTRSLCGGLRRAQSPRGTAASKGLAESKISSARIAFSKMPDHLPEPVGFAPLDDLQRR